MYGFRLLPCSILSLLFTSATAWNPEQRSLTTFSDTDIRSLATTPDPVKNLDPYDPHSHLYKILIPRPSDSENNILVRQHIIKTLQDLNWHIEEDSFEDQTPYGRKKFTNVIATKDPDAPRRMIMSAHFDSKFFPDAPMNQFLGATDSAAPCAMLLDLAESLNPLLEARKQRLQQGSASDEEEEASDTTLQLVFFDGEEAFVQWTATDSIYGARHLADRWETSFVSPLQARKLNRGTTLLGSIEVLVLLDLLGYRKPVIPSFYESTAWLYDGMVEAEHRLGSLGLFDNPNASHYEDEEWHAWASFFMPRTHYAHNVPHIEDDHIPFLHKGVNILHLIPPAFPPVWHSIKDDATALDIPTMKRWNLIFRIWAAEYLKLRPSLRTSQEKEKRAVDEL